MVHYGQYDLYLGYAVVGYKQSYCNTCPLNDIVPAVPTIEAVNKEIRAWPDGRIEEVCLACEFSAKLKKQHKKVMDLQAAGA